MSMRYQGRITEWRDEQGFGFITQNGSGKHVFLHITAFARRARRPAVGDIVTYVPGVENGRECAQRVQFADAVAQAAPRLSLRTGQGSIWSWLGMFYLTIVCIAVIMGGVSWKAAGYLATINLLTYLAYALDKKAARNATWRTPELRLHLFDLMGGWPAGLFAQMRLRHKTEKSSFQTMYKITVLLHLAAVCWLFSSYGSALRTAMFAG